jgi:transcription factor 1
LSVIADAAADLQLTVEGDKLLPYEDHWHPIPMRNTQDATESKPQTKRLGYPMVAGNIIPREEQVSVLGLLFLLFRC